MRLGQTGWTTCQRGFLTGLQVSVVNLPGLEEEIEQVDRLRFI